MDYSARHWPQIVVAAVLLTAGAGCGDSSASPESSQAQHSADEAFRAKFDSTKDGKASLRAMRESLRNPDGKTSAPSPGRASNLR
jgi:hypothetical protein